MAGSGRIEGQDFINQDLQDDPSSSYDNLNTTSEKNQTPSVPAAVEIQDSWIKCDFNNFTDFTRTTPAYCCIGDNVIAGESWARILVTITEMEIRKNNPAINDLYRTPLLSKMGRPYLMRGKISRLYCVQLSNSYWIDLNYSASRLLRLITAFCLHCGYPKEQILIYGAPKDKKTAKGKVSPVVAQAKPEEALKTYEQILIGNFENGYRIDSTIDFDKFLNYYSNRFGVKLDPQNRDQIMNCILRAGIAYDGYVYVPACMVPLDTREAVLEYIKNALSQENAVLYFGAIYRQFEEKFNDYDSHIYDEDMLRAYLLYECGSQYVFEDDFMSCGTAVKVDTTEEIKQQMLQSGAPIKIKELYNRLPFLSRKVIDTTVRSYAEFIRNANGEYFHISLIDLSEDELKAIAAIISRALKTSSFITGSDLLKIINNRYRVLERFAHFSPQGIINAFAFYLGKQFFFNGNIISANKPLTNSEIFGNFAAEHSTFTIDDLLALRDELNTSCYFEDVYANSLRINAKEFVSKDCAKFDVQKTDAAIAAFCSGDYIPFSAVTGFGTFPDAGFPWNEFLLEQYVASYSVAFKLLHNEFAAKKVVGAIVKRTSKIDKFVDLIADVLAHSNATISEDVALDYLCNEGLIARRRYSDIDKALRKAKVQR